jgi:competence protein ComEA
VDIILLLHKFTPLLKKHLLPLSLGLVGLLCLGYGLIQSLVTRGDSSEITFQSSEKTGPSTSSGKMVTATPKQIVVDVEGAVLRPGIHTVPAESRIQDALHEAGGLSEKADHAKVSQGMNLAAKVVDGAKLYIPFVGEAAPVVGGVGEIGEVGNGRSVNINSASESELDALPGVGPVTAQKIISNRPYGSIDELVSKKAVNKSVFSKIKDQVIN